MAIKLKRISADEARAKSADRVRQTPRGDAVVKAAKGAPSWDPGSRTARFVMTSESVDRYGDVIVTSGIDTRAFEDNPVALLFHNSRQWPIGNWKNLEKVLKGRPPRLEGDLAMLPAGGPVPEIDQTAWMIENGGVHACSIGFIPDWSEVEMILDEEERWTGGLRFPKSELVECSVVPVPANPDALAKALDNNVSLARELLEDILDNYAKSPAGLLIPRADYEAKYRQIAARSSVVVDKALSGMPTKSAKVADLKIDAKSDEEAAALVGATVVLVPGHPENKEWPFSDVLARAEGEVIASYIVKDGEKAGVHALWVEFLTDEYSGMFRGIAAERFALVAKDGDEDDEPIDPPEEEGTAEAPAAEAAEADAPADAPTGEQAEADAPPRSSTITIDVDVNTKGAEEKLGALSSVIDVVNEKIAKIFGLGRRAAPAEPAQPAVEAPSAEVIAAARQRAAETLARVKGVAAK